MRDDGYDDGTDGNDNETKTRRNIKTDGTRRASKTIDNENETGRRDARTRRGTRRGRYGIRGGKRWGRIYHHAPFNEAQSLSQNEDTARARGPFYFSPDPLPLVPPHLRTLNNPPPPGRGRKQAVIDLPGVLSYDLPSSHRPVPSHSLTLVRLLGINLRVIRAVPFSSSFIRYGAAGRSRRHHPAGGVSDIPHGLRPCVPLPAHSIRRTGR